MQGRFADCPKDSKARVIGIRIAMVFAKARAIKVVTAVIEVKCVGAKHKFRPKKSAFNYIINYSK
jgi:hypothetical protein